MDSFYGGRPGRDFGAKNYSSYSAMISDTMLPLNGYGIVTTNESCILYQKRYNGTAGQVQYVVISSLKGPKGDPGGGPATGISYTNTTSGLSATNVQDAIDEVVAEQPSDAEDISYDGTTSTLSAMNVQDAIDELASDFQDGCDTIAQAVIAKGQTPASNSPEDIADAIGNITTGQPGLETPVEFDWNYGWILNGTWTYQEPSGCYLDIYTVYANHEYRLMLGNTVGTRCTAMTTTEDIRPKTSGKVIGTAILNKKDSDVVPNFTYSFTSSVDGYFIVQKDNVNTAGIMTYLMDKTALP